MFSRSRLIRTLEHQLASWSKQGGTSRVSEAPKKAPLFSQRRGLYARSAPASTEVRTPTSLLTIRKKRASGEPLVGVTVTDAPTASIAEAAGVDFMLVGDSLGMVVLNQPNTIGVTMDQMIHHSRASVAGVTQSFVIGDMPFGSYPDPAAAVHNATRFLKEGNVHAVKLEGGARVLPQIRAIVETGIVVCGHLGLTPQTFHSLGGYKVQGKDSSTAKKILDDALALQEAGVSMLVLEMVPPELGAHITQNLSIPVIGIGAGPLTSGQILVFHDVVGLTLGHRPKFSKCYLESRNLMIDALKKYGEEVRNGTFPSEEHWVGVKSTLSTSSTHRLMEDDHDVKVVKTVEESRKLVRSYRQNQETVGFVPTMGALHEGHLSLVKKARESCDRVVCSIFVNPTQFAAHEDLDKYPKTLEEDLEMLRSVKADAVFLPQVKDMYPTWNSSAGQTMMMPISVVPHLINERTFEAKDRPHFFAGVATVCTKLFNIVQPDKVFFGQKDGIQCILIRDLIRNLCLPIELVVGDTVREQDGLAKSSRNRYLSAEERKLAPAIYRSLLAVQQKLGEGEKPLSVGVLKTFFTQTLAHHFQTELKASAIPPEKFSWKFGYLTFTNTETLEEFADHQFLPLKSQIMCSVAVTIGQTRLIDNIFL